MKQTDKERARQKEQLRQGMTVTPDKTEDEEDIKLRRHRLRRLGRLVLILLVIALAFGAYTLWQRYQRKQTFENHVISWEKEIVTTTKDKYLAYRDYLLRYNRDGISYINDKGEIVWTHSYEMLDPTVAVNGDFVAVIDRGGYQAYILNAGGCTGQITTILPIHKVTVSAGGVTAIVVEDGLADKVYFYDLSGRQIAIEVKTLLTEDGYTLDMELSPDGQQLVTAYVYLDQGTMKNQVVFRNFGEEGQEMIGRLVGGFRDYEGELLGRVTFLSDVYACAFAQDRICFYSLKNRVSPKLVKRIDYDKEISSVFYSSDYVGVIADGRNSVSKKITVFGQSGEKVSEFETDFAYSGANFSGGNIILYNNVRCVIYNIHGEIKYEANMGTNIVWASCLTDRTLLILDGQTLRAIALQ
ncbi:MAG: hypothetical protein IJA58_06500 [Lachnospiraceae bacterium]|nr:hypothetical protein [Lachnospiraceae bacterium]